MQVKGVGTGAHAANQSMLYLIGLIVLCSVTDPCYSCKLQVTGVGTKAHAATANFMFAVTTLWSHCGVSCDKCEVQA